jgi:RNA polymerase sigma-32 factor
MTEGAFINNPNALTTSFVPPGSDLNAYISSVHQFPLLSAERELELATRLQKDQDLDAARELILSHLRVVVSISRQYLNYGLSQGDIIQEGNIGLMKAVKRFDPARGVRLFSFAIHWIKAEINEFVLKNWKIVKIATTKAQRKLFFNLRGMKNKLGADINLNSDEAQSIADTLNVSKDEVFEMNKRLICTDAPLDGSNDSPGPIDFLTSENSDPAIVVADNQEISFEVSLLKEAIKNLDERSQIVISERWLKKEEGVKVKTLKKLADELDISAERVRQIEFSALGSLKKILEKRLGSCT